MKNISFKEAQAQLAQTMDQVCADHEPVVITRPKQCSVVLLSLEDYESWTETAYLLKSPANARRLFESVEHLGPVSALCARKRDLGRKAVTNKNYLALGQSPRKLAAPND